MNDENNQNEVTAIENTEPETRSSNLSVYEKEFDFVYELEITDDTPIVVNQGGVRTILLLKLDIDAKIKAYLEELGIIDKLKDLEDKIDDLEDKIKELEENGGGSGSGSGDDTTGDLTKKKLADCTWDQIKAYADAGTASEVFDIGDTKDINTADGVRTVAIMDFNKEEFKDVSGNICAIQFGTVFAGYTTKTRKNYSYSSDAIYNQEIEDMKNGFDSDLKVNIINFSYTPKDQAYNSGSTAWLPYSAYSGKVMAIPLEMLKLVPTTYTESTPFSYYENRTTIKRSENGEGAIATYWTGTGNSPSARAYYVTTADAHSSSITELCYDCFIFCM